MDDQGHKPHVRRANWSFCLVGLGSLLWLLLRSGTRPQRLAYPCQRAALVNSVGFAGYMLSLLGGVHLYHRLRRRSTSARTRLLLLALLLMSVLQSSIVEPARPLRAGAVLPSWTSPSAVSDVFVVVDVPTPPCSLDGGTLPATAPCNDPDYALHDAGVDAIVALMASAGTYFYQTAQYPAGLVGPDDIVIVKVNNQWGGDGDGDGYGRLATNTDVLKGLIWRILQHPDGFQGEVVVAENTQFEKDWDIYPANAQDPNQSFHDVISAYKSLGYPVSRYDWTSLNDSAISGGSVGDSGYPVGEYARSNPADAYILLEDPAGSGADELSYPKFQTEGGAYVSMRYGLWNGSSYEPDRLTFINLPVLKRHGMAGATAAWKNLIGFVSIGGHDQRYGSWDEMHRFFWGYGASSGDPNYGYGLLGREIALVRAPDLNIVDAIWVGYQDNTSGRASRQNVLLASIDPFAVDWYASEHVLRPLAEWDQADTSAARGGIFRRATRINQTVAKSVWPGGRQRYPYIDLLDSYDGSTPSDDEKNQMNVYISDGSVLPPRPVFLPLVVVQ